MTQNDSQAAFLTRVRAALKHARAWRKHTPVALKPAAVLNANALVEQFAAALRAVGGQVYQPADDAGICDQIVDITRARSVRRAAWIDAPALEGLGLREALTRSGIEIANVDFRAWIEREGDEDKARAVLREFLASADVAISGAQHAIAETGTLVLSAGTANPRSATNLPTIHMAVIRPAQIVATLFQLAPQLAAATTASSCLLFITGPSRTSDIEQIITVGVHGPVELHVIVRS